MIRYHEAGGYAVTIHASQEPEGTRDGRDVAEFVQAVGKRMELTIAPCNALDVLGLPASDIRDIASESLLVIEPPTFEGLDTPPPALGARPALAALVAVATLRSRANQARSVRSAKPDLSPEALQWGGLPSSPSNR